MNLMMLLEMAASGFGERAALTCDGRSVSYAELFHAAGTAARDISASDCERVALLDVSSPAVPLALFASAWAGCPFVPLSYRLTGSEVEALLAQIEPALLITGADRIAELSSLPGISAVARDDFLAKTRHAEATEASWDMDPDAIAILLFTSGTTGAPKAAVLRHKHLVSYILASVEFGSAAEGEAALVSVPPYHIAGMAAIASSVYAGRRIVQLASFSAEAWLELARRERVSHAFVVPTMLSRIVEALEAQGEAKLPQLRALSYGGGKMPRAVIESAMRRLPNADFTNAYGLTETSSTISILGPEDHRSAAASDDPMIQRRLSSLGRPLPGLEVEIRDADGRPLGPEECGEICVRGEQVSGEYLGRGSSVDADGWFPTRDSGWLDADGYLFLEGRADDVIVRGGENLSPGEIEDALLAHEAVCDAAVVGLPNEEWGEAVAAAIVATAKRRVSADELRHWVRGRLRSSRTPERIEFVDELPYTETGKLLRRKVRALLLAPGEKS